MNYVAVVYAVVTLLMLGYWFIRGRRTFRRRDERHQEIEATIQKEVGRESRVVCN